MDICDKEDCVHYYKYSDDNDCGLLKDVSDCNEKYYNKAKQNFGESPSSAERSVKPLLDAELSDKQYLAIFTGIRKTINKAFINEEINIYNFENSYAKQGKIIVDIVRQYLAKLGI